MKRLTVAVGCALTLAVSHAAPSADAADKSPTKLEAFSARTGVVVIKGMTQVEQFRTALVSASELIKSVGRR